MGSEFEMGGAFVPRQIIEERLALLCERLAAWGMTQEDLMVASAASHELMLEWVASLPDEERQKQRLEFVDEQGSHDCLVPFEKTPWLFQMGACANLAQVLLGLLEAGFKIVRVA